VYQAAHGNELFGALEGVSVRANGSKLTVSGRLAGLDMTQTFNFPKGKLWMEEHIVLRNTTTKLVSLDDLEIGFARKVKDVATDRWVAVPLRHRATDPQGYNSDFSMAQLVTEQGWEPFAGTRQEYQQIPSRHHISEGWAWLHGGRGVGIFKFSQETMQFSAVSKADDETLRFGGACMVSGEPSALTRVAPGQSVDLGVTRYEAVEGGYEQVSYAFRRMLDEKGCRFPKDFDAPVHWEQLYDMEGAWDERATRYTKAIIEKEAEKGRDYSCEAIYLDPGWDTALASFEWGPWLGPEKDFVEEMKSQYGLKLSLHCPLASWMSMAPGQWLMGPSSMAGWPQAALRTPPPQPMTAATVPATHDGRRNLALLPGARASASSVFDNGAMPIHQIDHLIDGWYGNDSSWIAGEMPCWAEVDLGGEHRISEVVLGNEHFGAFSDRAATDLTILVANKPGEWHEVAQLKGGRLAGTQPFAFAPVKARHIRVEITKAEEGLPRLDEIEIYGAEPTPGEFTPRRGPVPAEHQNGPRMCLGSKQYLDEAEKRLHKLCAEGATFLMFDGNWWPGGCEDPKHGHPIPYTREDHMRANLELAQRVHAKYPKVLIEMHDMLAGGSSARPTPIYYKYGLPGSFDDNWGFELMWNPMADLKGGRAASMYYYNLGCNIPAYLHIDLRGDNEECVELWWFASTCRHLGIGGTNPNPAVVRAEKAAMRQYKQWERFFKRGEFYGAGEQVHLHALPKEKAFLANVFNLSDEERTVTGEISLAQMGLSGSFTGSADWGTCADGVFRVSAKLPPWSARVGEFRKSEVGNRKSRE
jgi:hypothetical protein